MANFLTAAINRWAEKRALQNGSVVPVEQWRSALLDNVNTASGVTVNADTAMRMTAVYACVTILAESLASLPLILYRRTANDGKEKAFDHSLYALLHDMPNPEMTSMTLRETMFGHVLLRGNAYCYIESDARGNITKLTPLRPDKMISMRRMPDAQGLPTGEMIYTYKLPDSVGGQEIDLPSWKIWHFFGFSTDGLTGLAPLSAMRQAVGVALAAEEFGARLYSNNARPGGVLEVPGKLSETAFKHLKESWDESHNGLDNAHKAAILEEGMKFTEVGIPPEDAQFLETRNFEIAEIARIYHMPLALLQSHGAAATYASVEQFMLSFVVHTLRPWCVRFEQSIMLSLLLPKERKVYFAEHLVDALLRGDLGSRYNAYSTARMGGWLSVNEIRQRENMNPITGGDEYLSPLNMTPAGSQPKPARSVLQPVILDATTRIVRRECNDIRAQARKLLAKDDSAGFRQWLVEFYDEHAEFAARQLQPSLTAARMLASGPVDERYVVRYVKGHVFLARSRLLAVLDASNSEQLQAVERELDTWMSDVPADMAADFDPEKAG